MRSRAARSIVAVLALIALVASAAFLYRSEKQIADSTVAVGAFDLHAREASDALADLRSGQQAYVAAGQGVTFWMPRVASATDSIATAIRALRQSAASAEARALLDQAAATVDDFSQIDTRARDYLKAGQPLMAGDVIFTEGAESASNASRQVEAARLAERRAFDQSSSRTRTQEAAALAVGAAIALLALLLLVRLPSEPHVELAAAPAARSDDESSARLLPNLTSAPQTSEAPHAPRAPSPSAGPMMKSAAALATDVGRARDLDDLARLLERVAELMDASGVIIWLGSTTGADLRPVLAHGYSPQVVARMPAVPRSGDNAAAAAYRTGSMQIVLSRPGAGSGAVVAPILGQDGCVGALSAEIRHGGEASETVQALATLFAAQLASVVATAPAADTGSQTKTASA
jgi:hypothetical protein